MCKQVSGVVAFARCPKQLASGSEVGIENQDSKVGVYAGDPEARSFLEYLGTTSAFSFQIKYLP